MCALNFPRDTTSTLITTIDGSTAHQKLPVGFEFLLLSFFALFFGLSVHEFVDLVKNAHSRWFRGLYLFSILVLLFFPLASLHLPQLFLFLVHELELIKPCSQPLVPSMERYLESFDLLEEFLSIDFVNILSLMIFRVNHLMRKHSQHKVFFLRVSPQRSFLYNLWDSNWLDFSDWICVYHRASQSNSRNWWSNDEGLGDSPYVFLRGDEGIRFTHLVVHHKTTAFRFSSCGLGGLLFFLNWIVI